MPAVCSWKLFDVYQYFLDASGSLLLILAGFTSLAVMLAGSHERDTVYIVGHTVRYVQR